jgi:hypothetical protein
MCGQCGAKSTAIFGIFSLIIVIIVAMMGNVMAAMGVAVALGLVAMYKQQLRVTVAEGFAMFPREIQRVTLRTAPNHQHQHPDPDEQPDPDGSVPIPLSKQIIHDNIVAVNSVMNPPDFTADDKIFNASVVSGYKNKKAIEIRSHMNANVMKKYVDEELNSTSDKRNVWWSRNEMELSKKHVVF